MSDIRVPPWAARARDIFRTLLGLYVVLWLIRGVLALFDLGFDTDLYTAGGPTWLNVIFVSLFAVWIICGLVWLTGAAVAGYREPNEE